MGVMAVQPRNQGNYRAEHYTRSLEIVSGIAQANRSQFRVERIDAQPGWIALTEEYAMHPDDWRELQSHRYPMEGIATHTYTRCGQLLVPQLVAV